MIKERLGNNLDELVYRFFPFVRTLDVRPDTLTLLGAGVSFLVAVAFATDHPFGAFLLLLVAGWFDLVDGVVARRQGVASRAGAFFDSTIDRLSDLLIFGGIAYACAADRAPGAVALVMWAMTASVLTSYTRAAAEKHLHTLKVGFMERGERFGVLILGALTTLVLPAVLLIAIGATITALQRIAEGRRLLRQLEVTGVDPTLEPAAQPGPEAPRAG